MGKQGFEIIIKCQKRIFMAKLRVILGIRGALIAS
jgi:hypothetical protein